MGILTLDIDDFLEKQREFQAKKENLYRKLETAVETELPQLQTLLPQGYLLDGVCRVLDSDGRPSIHLKAPKENGKVLFNDEQTYKRLNSILQPTLEELTNKYGFNVSGFLCEEFIG